jgi:hypothetical protein
MELLGAEFVKVSGEGHESEKPAAKVPKAKVSTRGCRSEGVQAKDGERPSKRRKTKSRARGWQTVREKLLGMM